jgi:hypothetical protein
MRILFQHLWFWTGVAIIIITACLTGCGGHDMQNSVTLATSASVANANYIIARINGVWQAMGTGADDAIIAVVVAPDGTVYAGGKFHNIGGVACAHVAKWNGLVWSALGAGADDQVSALALGPDGSLYAGGHFLNAGTGAAAHVAKWDGTAWSALGAGVDNDVWRLAVDSTGLLYAGGVFHNAGGAGALHIASWDGAAWAPLHASGLDDLPMGMAIDASDRLYVAGAFHNAGGAAALHVARWTGTAWEALAGGVNADADAVAVAPDGRVYFGGVFTVAGTVAVNQIAVYNGSGWAALGTGLDDYVQTMLMLDNGNLLVGGHFVTAGGLPFAGYVAEWNRSSWSAVDIDLPGTPVVAALAKRGNDLYIGYNTAGTATVSGGGTTTITNSGTARAMPKITLKRSGGTSATLESIYNLTTGDKLYFNYPLADGETVVISCTQGRKAITSDFIGNAIDKLLPNSNFGAFGLEPGDNIIAVYVSTVGSPTITATMQWDNTYSSMDGATS